MSAACRGRPICLAMIQAKERGAPIRRRRPLPRRVESAVAEVVEKQAESGIDIVADGEMGRFGFIPYVNERLAGIEPRQNSGRAGGWAQLARIPRFSRILRNGRRKCRGRPDARRRRRWVCTGPISYRGHDALQRDIDNLKAALAAVSARGSVYAGGVARPISPIGTPTNTTRPTKNSGWRWPTRCARNTGRSSMPGSSCRSTIRSWPATGRCIPRSISPNAADWASASVELLNHALAGIPAERVRYHTCYSINMGPRVHDIELRHIVDIMLRVEAGAYSFEAANPRHEHEWRVWETVKLPAGKVAGPRRRHPCLEPGRASRNGRPAHRPLCRRGRARERDRRRRLRLCQLFDLVRGPSERRLGQACRTRRRRASGDPGIVGPALRNRRRA